MTQAWTNPFTDIAALSLYAFYAFFLVLVLWLHREGKREGYPLIPDREGRGSQLPIEGFPGVPDKKVFLLDQPVHAHGEERLPERDLTGLMQPVDIHPGSPLDPIGDPMKNGVGAASYAQRADVPDLAYDDRLPKIVPLRASEGYTIAEDDPNPIGSPVITLDGKVAGTVVDAWVDRSEVILRYFEVEVAGSGHRVLVPTFLSVVKGDGTVLVKSVTARQLAEAPRTAKPEQVTLLEEDKIAGYFGGGHLHATPERSEPLL